jgi:hypothetical protein
MSSLLREIIPLALAAAISPVIFLLQLNTLTGQRPIARGAALTAGVVVDRQRVAQGGIDHLVVGESHPRIVACGPQRSPHRPAPHPDWVVVAPHRQSGRNSSPTARTRVRAPRDRSQGARGPVANNALGAS